MTPPVGKSFRSYCSFACNGGASGQYANITVDTNAPASPVKAGGTYRIGNGSGQVLSQVPDNRTSVTSGSMKSTLRLMKRTSTVSLIWFER